jgi:hypothetical protein
MSLIVWLGYAAWLSAAEGVSKATSAAPDVINATTEDKDVIHLPPSSDR